MITKLNLSRRDELNASNSDEVLDIAEGSGIFYKVWTNIRRKCALNGNLGFRLSRWYKADTGPFTTGLLSQRIILEFEKGNLNSQLKVCDRSLSVQEVYPREEGRHIMFVAIWRFTWHNDRAGYLFIALSHKPYKLRFQRLESFNYGSHFFT